MGSTGINPLHHLPNKKEDVLFNDALNTFYLQLCGVGHIARIVRVNPLLFQIDSNGFVICIIPQTE